MSIQVFPPSETTLANELVVSHHAWVEFNPQCLSMIGAPRAHRTVIRVRHTLLPTRIPHGGLQDALVLRNRIVLQENVFDAPEASCSKGGDLGFRAGHGGDRLGCGAVLEGGGGGEGKWNEPVEAAEHVQLVSFGADATG